MLISRLSSTKGGDASTDSRSYEQQAAMIFERNISREGTESDLAEGLLAIKAMVDSVADCVSGLINCLQHEVNAVSRRQAVEALIWVYIQDASVLGGVGGISDEVPSMIPHLSASDKQIAKEQLEAAMAQGDGEWADEQYRELLEEIDRS